MRGTGFVGLSILGLAALAHGTPTQAGVERRQAASTSTSIAYTYVTATAAPASTTVFPQDVTSYITIGTVLEYAYTTSSVRTSGCVVYSYQDPKPTVPVVTVTSTITLTTRSTVTVTDSTSPPKTVVSVTVDVERTSAGLTQWSTRCTNTLVESRYYASTRTVVAMPSVSAYTRTTVTSVCVVSSRVSLAVHGGPTPTTEPYVPAISRFRESGPETVVTVKAAASAELTVTVPDRTSTATETVCDNPSTSTTQVWYVVTATPPLATSYVTAKDCGAPTTAAAAAAVQARHEDGGESFNAAAPSGTPLRMFTTTFETVGLVDNTVVTSQATAVYEVRVQTFTTVFNEPLTVTASRPPVVVTVCPK